MFKQWRRRRAIQRVRPGDGLPLKRFRWWQPLIRSLFYLPSDEGAGRSAVYAVDVHHLRSETENGNIGAHLYRDGRRQARAELPTIFTVEGGTIEVIATTFGLRRCHYVTDEGAEQQLVPDPRSGEGRRARLDREHPVLSRWISAFSLIVLLGALLLTLPQLAESLSRIPPVAERWGTFTSPLDLPLWSTIVLAVSAGIASTERAMRLRYRAWLDEG
ncbi:hypothetical protein [Plantactinospora soyae]|uniref:Uncharacterized protein n=1 Tax=Plantactinospora soyae TaxID=1544732 RepID=A0A927M7L6_9ACTN|nr:hypothetical protein [Plantactinospora soyae]MBE1489259.1 hypothetical protein [Plantactinospora soyae]